MGSLHLPALLAAEELEQDDAQYRLPWLRAPVLTGLPLRLFLAAMESGVAGPLRRRLMRDNGLIQALEEVFIPEPPTFQPNTAERCWPPRPGAPAPDNLILPAGSSGAAAAAGAVQALAALAAGGGGGGGASDTASSGGGASRVAEFHQAYKSGRLTPTDIAERLIAAVQESEASDPPLRCLIAFDPEHLRRQAAASSERWAAGRPLCVLDGVPFAVKDALDIEGYETTAGTAWMAQWRAATGTNPAVQALLESGALLAGKTNLHEIGIGTSGLNTVHGTPRNPYDVKRHTGASSSGSAAMLAAGLVPIAVGTDGGGSIRIPSSLCGLVGLKPTHNRVCTKHSAPIDASVAVTGPMATTVADCALLYAIMANRGHAPHERLPPVALPRLGSPGQAPAASAAAAAAAGDSTAPVKPLAGLLGGVFRPWCEDAHPAVAEGFRDSLAALEAAGMAIVDVALPELDLLRAAHTCTITCEMRNSMLGALNDPATRRRFNLETRATLALADGFSASAYVQSQKIRTRAEKHFRAAFARCDVILSPTTALAAPPVKPGALRGGESDLNVTSALMRYAVPANMLGLPALTVPVITTSDPCAGDVAAAAAGHHRGAGNSAAEGNSKLPIGLQIMGRPWQEALLFRVAAALEAAVGTLERPPVHWDLLRLEE